MISIPDFDFNPSSILFENMLSIKVCEVFWIRVGDTVRLARCDFLHELKSQYKRYRAILGKNIREAKRLYHYKMFDTFKNEN